MDLPNLRWWGWGTLDQSYDLSNRPGFWPFMQANLGVGPGPLAEPAPMDAIAAALPPPRLDAETLRSLRKKFGATVVNAGNEARILHAYGKSYKDLVRLRRGQVARPPDAVVFPESEEQIVELLAWAAQRGAALVPFGGGSSVTSGVEPRGDRPTLTVDLARLNQIVHVNVVSQTATVQAGILGPALERAMNARGLTLGHFPQSYEFSTLGGWIATRSAGQTSVGYGKIEEMVQAVRVVTPVGVVETRPTPAQAVGPSLLEALVGSEGAFGVITQATLRLHRKPEASDYRGVIFRRFEDGVAAVREIMQGGADVVMARLSDGPETVASLALSRAPHSPLSALTTRIGLRTLAAQGYDLAGKSCLMILGVEGERARVLHNVRAAMSICRRHGGFDLGQSVGKAWLRERFALPYLRDTFLGRGLMVDTLETATTWDNLAQLYAALTDALRRAIAAGGVQPYVMTHVSHSYADGASLYSTFLGRQIPGREIEQWWSAKRAATEAILANNGTLSHHHGVGADHAPWLEREHGALGVAALRALKATFDPQGIMNPGILVQTNDEGRTPANARGQATNNP